jgi:hypothetical protein
MSRFQRSLPNFMAGSYQNSRGSSALLAPNFQPSLLSIFPYLFLKLMKGNLIAPIIASGCPAKLIKMGKTGNLWFAWIEQMRPTSEEKRGTGRFRQSAAAAKIKPAGAEKQGRKCDSNRRLNE